MRSGPGGGLAQTAAPWASGRRPPREGPPAAALERAQVPRWPPAAEGPSGRRIPGKRLETEEGLERFLESDTCMQFHGFLVHVALSARGTRRSDQVVESPTVTGLCELLEEAAAWQADFPPAPQVGRFGNQSFRDWHSRMRQRSRDLLRDKVLARAGGTAAGGVPPVGEGDARALPAEEELAPYLEDSFGNATRLDYGSGHETAFAALLFCLARLGALEPSDGPALVTRVFTRYLELARSLQRTYCLEPAGSHGVWGLDDYQFLAFLFGAAQLAGHPFIRPRSIHSADVVETYGGEYLYLGCVRHVLSVKKGAITTTSPMLNDVSGVRGGWEKVTSGLVKMYKGEVLAKLPIMQHFLFGSLLPFPAPPGPLPGPPPAFS